MHPGIRCAGLAVLLSARAAVSVCGSRRGSRGGTGQGSWSRGQQSHTRREEREQMSTQGR